MKLKTVDAIRFSADPYGMNWLREDMPYAQVRCPQGLESTVTHEMEGDILHTEIRISNPSDKPYITKASDIGISLPIDTRYNETECCLTSRAHVHLFCGGDISWVMAMRMGGDAPHMGMVLTQGSLAGYSIEHNGPLAHDRGKLILHPASAAWQPGEVKVWAWTIFPHQGEVDFFRRLPDFCRYVHVESNRYVLYPGEEGVLTVRPAFEARQVTVDGQVLENSDGVYTLRWTACELGEHIFQVEADGVRTWCRVLTHPSPAALAEARVRFLRDHQQYHGDLAALDGAYLAYDNEEEHILYTPENDYNGGRERVAMGILMARYLSGGGLDADGSLRRSLEAYRAYVLRELVDEQTGQVFNDIGRDLSYLRTYNYPWFAEFFLEYHRLTGDMDALKLSWRIAMRFYEQENGVAFYPIELPIVELDEALTRADLLQERDALRAWEIRHAERLLETDIHYPPFEVAFEQSIIGPAADVLLQVYQLTGEERYLRGAEVHLRLLELFNGHQPDYHCHEVALRNWDGYWFGKYKVFGDTFPHYWSGITANVFQRYADLTGHADYARRAENSRRGVLPLVFPDGRASCAYVYPMSSNGTRGGFYDPYANDQDWGLYFSLRFAK